MGTYVRLGPRESSNSGTCTPYGLCGMSLCLRTAFDPRMVPGGTQPAARATRLSSPESVWLVAVAIRTCVSSPGAARPAKLTTLL